jgi:hypothetical protein
MIAENFWLKSIILQRRRSEIDETFNPGLNIFISWFIIVILGSGVLNNLIPEQWTPFLAYFPKMKVGLSNHQSVSPH